MTIIIFIIILAVLILVHEFGHFLAAKKSGVRVDEFGLGFPPKIWSKQKGETLYTLNAIPFGGFVKIFGEDPHNEEIREEEKPRSFYYKPKWIQAIILIAGIFFNLIFAYLLISIGFIFGMPTPIGYSAFGEVKNEQVLVTSVLSGSPASNAGIKIGDVLTSVKVGEKPILDLTPENISKSITQSTKGDVTIEYKRGGEVKEAVITPSEEIIKGSRAIGVAMDMMGTLKLPVHLAFLEGFHTTYILIKGTAQGLTSFIWKAITFRSDLSQVTGPVGIASVVGEASRVGFVNLMSLVALISINLALINLVPFPALDGGRLLFVLIESITRRPIKPVVAQWANAIGFVLLLVLMFVVTAHDIIKLF